MNLEKLFKTTEVCFGDTFNLEKRDYFLVYYFLWVKKKEIDLCLIFKCSKLYVTAFQKAGI